MTNSNKNKIKVIKSIDELFKLIDIKENTNISFHHHLRNGDGVINYVLDKYLREGVGNLNLFPSAIFPGYMKILELIEHGLVNNINLSRK